MQSNRGDVIRLWEDDAPRARGTEPHDVPILTAYWPASPTGSAIIVCPGGGYGGLADHEGEPIAHWLNAAGITAFVLRYRHSGGGYQHPTPLGDVSRAIRTVRARAGEWGVDGNRLGVLGFSAGGHLAATLCTQFDLGDAASPDPIERASSRPDVSILLYPVITLTDPLAHAGSRTNLLGVDATAEQIAEFSAEKRVTARTPPTFLFHTVEDQAVPVENSLMYAAALRAAKVPFELHVYEPGNHGVGLATSHPSLSTWPALCVAWLKGRGF